MYISKADALAWFEFFAELPEEEPLSPRQQELALAVLSQIELAEEARVEKLKSEIPGLKSLGSRTLYVGDSAVDVQTARAAELELAAVSWGFASAQSLRQAGAKQIFDTVSALEEYIFR